MIMCTVYFHILLCSTVGIGPGQDANWGEVWPIGHGIDLQLQRQNADTSLGHPLA